MSSALLYLAIVAIWAGVLMPKWLRPGQAHRPQAELELRQDAASGDDAGLMAGQRAAVAARDLATPAEGAAAAAGEITRAPGATPGRSGPAATSAATPAAAATPAGAAAPAGAAQPGSPGRVTRREEPGEHRAGAQPAAQDPRRDAERREQGQPGPVRRAAGRPGPGHPGAAPAARDGQAVARDAEPGRAPRITRDDAARRASILSARRRMLLTLVALTLGAVVIALTGLADVWVIIPPAVLLGGFLLLLREAARTDAERAQARAHPAAPAQDDMRFEREVMRPERPGPAEYETAVASAAPATPSQAVPGPAAQAAYQAEVIDITAQVADEPYDQYTDAAKRAVGD